MKAYRELIERKYYKNGSQTFNPSSELQTFVVPSGTTKLNVDCVASKGADATLPGANGGRVQCVLPVTAGDTLYFMVGDIPASNEVAEYNASDIRTDNTGVTDNTSLSSRLVVAGGGGSPRTGVSNSNYYAGAGGGLEGQQCGYGGAYGKGGTQSAGGSQQGTFGLGGSGNQNAGGAGWYGGGYGGNGAGGGSSYTDSSCRNVTHTQGYNAGAGYITITYVEDGTESDYDFYKDIYQYKVKTENINGTEVLSTLKSLEKGQYSTSLTKAGYTVLGSPIIDSGTAENFNANSYLKLEPYIPAGDFELQVAFTLPSTLVDNSYVCEFPNMFSLGFSAGNTSKMIGWNWSSSSFVTIIPSPNVVAGSYYKVKVKRTGSDITTSWSKDGGDFSAPQLYVSNATQTSYGTFGNAVTNTASRYFRGTIDLENTYIKSSGFIWFPPELNYLGTAEAVGTPTISNGIVSNFTSSSYISLTNGFNPGNNPWESVIKVKVNSFTNKNTIISYQFSGTKSYQVSVGNGGNAGKLIFYASSDGSNTNIANNVMSSTAVLTTETWYWIRVKFTGSAYEVAYSTDGENYTTCITVNSSTVIRQNTQNSYGFNFAAYPEVLDGEIDFNGMYIKINGHYWFKGELK